MPLDEGVRQRLFEQYLPKGWSLSEELALLALQSEAKQKIVQQRLQALDRYLGPSSEDVGNGDLAAANLGVGRRQLVNLVAKLRKLGPTRALTPGFRNVPRPSVARTGLGRRAEWHLANLLRRDQSMRLSKIEAHLRDICDEEGISLPGTSSIRKRVLSLRARPFGGEELALFGAQLLIDQIYLDLPVKDGKVARFPILTLIVDQQTKLILGHHLMPSSDQGAGLHYAMKDGENRIETFAEGRVPVAEQIESVTWIIPKNLEIFAIEAQTGRRLAGTRVDIVRSSTRRLGAAILRTIGDRLPPFSFKPTPTERGLLPDKSGIPLREARELISARVDRWNADILSDHKENIGRQTVQKLPQLIAINQALRELIEPVIDINRESVSVFDHDI